MPWKRGYWRDLPHRNAARDRNLSADGPPITISVLCLPPGYEPFWLFRFRVAGDAWLHDGDELHDLPWRTWHELSLPANTVTVAISHLGQGLTRDVRFPPADGGCYVYRARTLWPSPPIELVAKPDHVPGHDRPRVRRYPP